MTDPLPRTGELNTWQEIADYLGISKREAQDREKENGMPIHRLPGKKSRVWAYRSELDEWKAQAEDSGTTSNAAGDSLRQPEVSPVPPVNDESAIQKSQVARRAVLGLVGTAATAIGASVLFRPRVRRVERAVLSGNLLTALDGTGGTVWTHRFPGTLQPQTDGDNPGWRVQVLDLEGSGNPGVLAICNYLPEPSASRPMSDELFYFGPEGRIRWTYSLRPDLIDFNGKPIEPVWRFSHLITVPHGNEQTLWAGVQHGWRWPGCVMRFDAAGSPSIQFANSGFVERLCRLMRPDGEFIAVSGESNAFDRACVAVLGINDPPSRSPEGGAKRCTFANAPSGSPRDYILFPTTEMVAAMDAPYGNANQAYATNDGGLVVEVWAARNPTTLFLYEFSAATEPKSVMPSGSCPLFHRRLEQEKRLNHSWAACPELANPFTIRHWRPATGWRDERVPWRAATGEG